MNLFEMINFYEGVELLEKIPIASIEILFSMAFIISYIWGIGGSFYGSKA